MTAATPTDITRRFLLENLDIRGQVVRLGPVWRSILARREIPGSLRPLLGEFAALSVLVGAGLKHDGRAVLQVMGHGPISLAVADCTHELHLRAMLKVDASALPAGAPARVGIDAAHGHDLHELFADGRLALTLENSQTGRQFQSIVPLEGATLAECFERYFDQSEQVPTHLWVHTTAETVGALILQRLPGADERDPDGWARIQQATAQAAPLALAGEIANVDIPELLTSLFPEEDIRLFKPLPVTDGCGRSEEKVASMLRGLGRAEVEATLAEHGVVVVRDEICNQEYRYTAAQLERIFPS